MEKNLTFEKINEIARNLGTYVQKGDVVVLIGDLGSGKTAFTKEFAKGLGITVDIKSPTFNYVLEYLDGRLPLYHFDMYRITDPQEIYELGYDEYIQSAGVCVIEWGDLIETELPLRHIQIKFKYSGENTRDITLTYPGGNEKEIEEYVGFSH
jgi:tRNA threonylcarbamoyladenosine biosynthesis protein TsaE